MGVTDTSTALAATTEAGPAAGAIRQRGRRSRGEPVRLLLVGRHMERMAGQLREAAAGVEVVVAATAEAGEAFIGEVDAVVLADRVRPAYLTAPRLRWMHIVGAGVDGFAIAGLRDAPFTITHKVMASTIPMAEHVMAQILLIARRALEFRALQAERRWARAPAAPHSELIEVAGTTLGIVGLGNAALALARRAKPFGMRVIGTKRTPVARLPNVDRVYAPADLHTVLAASDFVAILAPLTDETHQLIGEAELRAMKPTAYLINISRGPIIRETVLIRALRERWIAGASLDVFEHEPLDPASPLWELPNAIITPHCGGVGPHLSRESAAEIARNLRRFVQGKDLLYQLKRADIVTTFTPPSH